MGASSTSATSSPAWRAAATASTRFGPCSRIRSGSRTRTGPRRGGRRSSSIRASSSSSALLGARRDTRRTVTSSCGGRPGSTCTASASTQQGESLRKVHWRTTAEARRADGEGARRHAPRRGCSAARRGRAVRSPASRSTSGSRGTARSCARTRSADASALLSITSSPPETLSVGSIDSEWRSALELLAAAEPTGRPAGALPRARCSPALHAVELVVVTGCARAAARRRCSWTGRSLARPRLARARRRGELQRRRACSAACSLRSCGSRRAAFLSRPVQRGRRPRRQAERARGGARGQWLRLRRSRSCSGLLIAWNWGRLETGRSAGDNRVDDPARGRSGAPALAAPPARRSRRGADRRLVDRARRPAVRPQDDPGTRPDAGSSTSTTCSCRSTASEHHLMDGVVLLAIFTFTASGVSRDRLAPSAPRKPRARGRSGLAVDDLPRARRPRSGRVAARWRALTRRAPRADTRAGAHRRSLVATTLAVTALIASSWNGVAKAQFLDWQKWDLSTKSWALRQRRVTSGTRTTAASTSRRSGRACSRVKTGDQRGRLLAGDDPRHVRRQRMEGGTAPDRGVQAATAGPRDRPHGRPAAAASARATRGEVDRGARCTSTALRDRHVISPSGPVAYDGLTSLDGISYYRGGVAEVTRAADAWNASTTRGSSSHSPRPRSSRSRRLGTRARSARPLPRGRQGLKAGPPFGTRSD